MEPEPFRASTAADQPWASHWITRHRAVLIALAAVLPVLPLALRQPTIWYDEGYTFFYARVPLGSLPRALWDLDLYTAGFYLIERIGVSVFGVGQVGLRVVPALFAVASVVMFSAVLRRRRVRPTPQVLITALFAAAPAMAAHAGNGRAYSMVTFWYLLCLYVCLGESPLTRRRAVLLGSLLGGGLYVHASLIVGLPLLGLLVLRRYGLRRAIWPLGLGALLTVPLGVQLATHTVNGVGAGLRLQDVTPRRLASIAWHFTWNPVLLLVFGAALIALSLDLLRRRTIEWNDRAGVWMEFAGIVLPFVVAVAVTPVVSLWSWSYLWLGGIGVFLAGARGIDLVAGWIRRGVRTPRWARVLVVVLVVAALLGVNVRRNFSNDDLQGAYGQLVSRVQPGDAVVAPLLADALAMRYQAALHPSRPEGELLYAFRAWDEPVDRRMLAHNVDDDVVDLRGAAGGRRVWIVHWDPIEPVSARAIDTTRLARRFLADYCFRPVWSGQMVIILEGVRAACPDSGLVPGG